MLIVYILLLLMPSAYAASSSSPPSPSSSSAASPTGAIPIESLENLAPNGIHLLKAKSRLQEEDIIFQDTCHTRPNYNTYVTEPEQDANPFDTGLNITHGVTYRVVRQLYPIETNQEEHERVQYITYAPNFVLVSEEQASRLIKERDSYSLFEKKETRKRISYPFNIRYFDGHNWHCGVYFPITAATLAAYINQIEITEVKTLSTNVTRYLERSMIDGLTLFTSLGAYTSQLSPALEYFSVGRKAFHYSSFTYYDNLVNDNTPFTVDTIQPFPARCIRPKTHSLSEKIARWKNDLYGAGNLDVSRPYNDSRFKHPYCIYDISCLKNPVIALDQPVEGALILVNQSIKDTIIEGTNRIFKEQCPWWRTAIDTPYHWRNWITATVITGIIGTYAYTHHTQWQNSVAITIASMQQKIATKKNLLSSLKAAASLVPSPEDAYNAPQDAVRSAHNALMRIPSLKKEIRSIASCMPSAWTMIDTIQQSCKDNAQKLAWWTLATNLISKCAANLFGYQPYKPSRIMPNNTYKHMDFFCGKMDFFCKTTEITDTTNVNIKPPYNGNCRACLNCRQPWEKTDNCSVHTSNGPKDFYRLVPYYNPEHEAWYNQNIRIAATCSAGVAAFSLLVWAHKKSLG